MILPLTALYIRISDPHGDTDGPISLLFQAVYL